jgi:hypothetical protein
VAALGAVDEHALARIEQARAGACAAAWAAGADPGFCVIDIDGVLIDADSHKQHAAPTYKHGFGFYPLLPKWGDGVAFESADMVEVELLQGFSCRETGGADPALTAV